MARKVMVIIADDELAGWVEFNGSLSAGQSGMSGYFNRVARQDMEHADDERLQAYRLWSKLHESE